MFVCICVFQFSYTTCPQQQINLDTQFSLGDHWNKDIGWPIPWWHNKQHISDEGSGSPSSPLIAVEAHMKYQCWNWERLYVAECLKDTFPRFNNYLPVSAICQASWLGCAPTYYLGSLWFLIGIQMLAIISLAGIWNARVVFSWTFRFGYLYKKESDGNVEELMPQRSRIFF